MNNFEDNGLRSARGRRPSSLVESHDTSYFSIKESRTVIKDGRRHIEAKSVSPNPGPRYQNLELRVCPIHDCWWHGDSGGFLGHVEQQHTDEPEWQLLFDSMYLFKELRPESPAPVYRKTKHDDRDH